MVLEMVFTCSETTLLALGGHHFGFEDESFVRSFTMERGWSTLEDVQLSIPRSNFVAILLPEDYFCWNKVNYQL